MSNSINISPQHGVNPTIPVCFFCGEDKNEVVLLGKLKGDKKAPMHMCLDYEPCDKCKELFAQGILLMGVTQHPSDDRPSIQEGLYPTGRYIVVQPAFIARMFDEETATNVLNEGKALIADDVLYQIQKNFEQAQKGE